MAEYLTNAEVVEYLGLQEDIITKLQTEQGTSYTATANEFIEALVNKIVYQTVDTFGWKNPFRKYDSFPVNYGDTIENIFVELPKGYTFDKDATDPFTKYIPSVKVLYASINYEMQYCVTIQDALLRRAALNEYGFNNLITNILASMVTSKNVDEYFATLAMLNNEDLYANGFEEIDVSDLVSDAEKAKKITQAIVDVVSGFQLPNNKFNKMGVMTATNPQDVLLMVRRDIYNSINLDYLAGVFNLQKVDLVKNIMQVESFQTMTHDETQDKDVVVGEDLAFIVVDTRAFDNHVCLEDGGMIYNPKGKYTNHFTNLWRILSFKYFYNARAFTVTFEAANAGQE